TGIITIFQDYKLAGSLFHSNLFQPFEDPYPVFQMNNVISWLQVSEIGEKAIQGFSGLNFANRSLQPTFAENLSLGKEVKAEGRKMKSFRKVTHDNRNWILERCVEIRWAFQAPRIQIVFAQDTLNSFRFTGRRRYKNDLFAFLPPGSQIFENVLKPSLIFALGTKIERLDWPFRLFS